MNCKGCIPVLMCYFATLLSFSSQVTYGAYIQELVESGEVCSSGESFSTLSRKRIRLSNYPNGTVKIKVTGWNNTYPHSLNPTCKFEVVAPSKKQGVMVVIQQMHLRTNRTTPTLSCTDYIKFDQADGLETGKICGRIDKNEVSKSPPSLTGQRYFYDDKGSIEVSFFLQPKEVEEEPLSLIMIFTAYSECSDIGVSSGRFRRCSSLRFHSCIPSHLFCDDEINCAFPQPNDFGVDEENCDEKRGNGWEGKGEKEPSIEVLIGICAGTLLIISIFLILPCFCLRRCKGERSLEQSGRALAL